MKKIKIDVLLNDKGNHPTKAEEVLMSFPLKSSKDNIFDMEG